MDDRIIYVVTELQNAADDAQGAFGSLSEEQLNWRPLDNGWSVGQCLDHLIRTDEQFYPEMDKLAAGTRKNSLLENWSPFTGFFGRFLIKAVSDDSKKAKAPSKNIVPPSDIRADIVVAFTDHIGVLIQKINACVDADRGKTVVTSPFLSVMTYKLDDAYTVLVEHTKRHIRQAKRVTAHDWFRI